jgi:hypothetical protein
MSCNSEQFNNAISLWFSGMGRLVFSLRDCARDHLNYRRGMGQQHRVRAKRKRRKAYLRRKKATTKVARREAAAPKARKQQAAPPPAE